MKFARPIHVAIFCFATLLVRADVNDPTFKTRAARNAKADFDTTMKEVSRDAVAKTLAAMADYQAKLERALTQATQNQELDDALRIRETIARLKAGAAAIRDADAPGKNAVLTEREDLTRALEGTSWTSGGKTWRFNADCTATDGKDPWLWAALDAHDVVLRSKAGWTNRLTFDDERRTFNFQEYGNGTPRPALTGKRLAQ